MKYIFIKCCKSETRVLGLHINSNDMNFNVITPETLERFESLPRVHKSKIINRMIFYKSCYGTPTGRSEKGLFETVAFKHIATLCPNCNGSGEIEKMDYNLVCMDCLGSGSKY